MNLIFRLLMRASAALSIPAGSLSFLGTATPLQILPSRNTFDNVTTWSVFLDVEYTGGANRVAIGVRRPKGFNVQINNGILRVSNWAAFTSGTTTFSAGRYKILVTYDGTTLKAWVKTAGGVVTQEINATVTFAFASSNLVAFGSSCNTTATIEQWNGKIYVGAYWKATLTEADRDVLFGGADPRTVALANLHWYPSPATAEDLSGNHVTHKKFSAPTTVMAAGSTGTLGNPDNFVVLRDPDSGAPIQHAGNYWACYDTLNGSSKRVVELATSANLTTWVYDRTVMTSTTGADHEIRVCDFIYLGNEAGAHDPFQIYTANSNVPVGNVAKMNLYTSSDLTTWTPDAANPVFTNDYSDRGVEDFRIVKVGANNWGAVYELNGLEDGSIAIGQAQHTGAVPTGAWTNANNVMFSDADFGYAGPAAFTANPCIVKKDGVYYCFYEGANSGEGGTATGFEEVTFLRTSTDFFTPSSWQKKNIVAFGGNTFPNCAIVSGGVIYHYNVKGGTSAERFTYDPTQLFTA